MMYIVILEYMDILNRGHIKNFLIDRSLIENCDTRG